MARPAPVNRSIGLSSAFSIGNSQAYRLGTVTLPNRPQPITL